MDLYRENILDHYKHPRNFGHLNNAGSFHEESNPFCGDRIRIEVRSQNLKVRAVKFSGEGCAISIATASMLTEHIQGMPIGDLHKLDKDVILELLGIQLSPTRLKCALLPLEVLQKAVAKIHG